VNRVCDVWVLILMLGGTLHFTEDGAPVELNAGEWYLQAPGLRQEGHRPCPAPLYYYIHFDSEAKPAGDPGFSITAPRNYQRPEQALLTLPVRGTFAEARFLPLCDQLERAKRLRPSDAFLRQAVFLEILSSLADTLQPPRLGSATLAKAVMDYLCAHFTEDVMIRRLPRQFHFSSDYLSKLFAREYGRTPKEHLQELRVSLAMELLATTDMTVAQVAEAAGYSDLSVFYRAFKSRSGLSPSDWRNRAAP
jgi:AraC-like DNA-binding protein